MTFNSLQYAVFLLVVVSVYWRIPARGRRPMLVAGSYLFYGLWDYRFLSLIALSTVVDFNLARRIFRSRSARTRKRLLWASVIVNLSILGFFKYAGFFVDSATTALEAVGFGANPSVLKVVLPVGISFYTFQTISYTFDVYRERIEPTNSLTTFALYVSFFPQLVAGPIERARHLLPQIERIPGAAPPDVRRRVDAAGLILVGLVKKVVLADGIAPLVNTAFDGAGSANALTLVAGVVAFAIQIYGDFGGYTDIARGSARLLGVDLVRNFRQPYLARNITEFWRRWHISLSDWLRDYLYVPLGGNRGSRISTYRNLMVTMLLGGLWHGAAWTFVVWGLLHGVFLAAHRFLRSGHVAEAEFRWRSFGDISAAVTTFGMVCFAWIFFRAGTFSEAFDLMKGIATLRGIPSEVSRNDLADLLRVGVWLAVTLSIDQVERSGHSLYEAIRRTPALAGIAVGTGITGLVTFSGQTSVQFIYFQF